MRRELLKYHCLFVLTNKMLEIYVLNYPRHPSEADAQPEKHALVPSLHRHDLP